MNTFMLVLVVTGLVFIVVLLIRKKKKSPYPLPSSNEEEPVRCKTYLVTQLNDPSSSNIAVVVFEDCDGTTTSEDLKKKDLLSVTICATRIIHSHGVEIKKLFDYCTK